ncbi:MAG: exosortase/archaeosortase family protein [Nitrospira sp.]|nr:exosortase/archaeosortase family protein [Nitrospira sp.]
MRMMDASDEPWGLLALGTVVVFFLWKKPEVRSQKPEAGSFCLLFSASYLLLPALFTLLYAGTYVFLPPLLRAGIAVTAIGCLVSSYRLRTPFHVGAWGLLLLSLPVMPSLQFYLGYPLRALVATLAAPLLQLSGFAVVPEGTFLNWGSELIWIDAPCSGVRMLWAGFYLTFTLACFYGLSLRKTCGASVLSLLAIILGNTLRSTALFYVEADVVALPSWIHESVGVVVFLFTAVFIVGWIQYIRDKVSCGPSLSS